MGASTRLALTTAALLFSLLDRAGTGAETTEAIT